MNTADFVCTPIEEDGKNCNFKHSDNLTIVVDTKCKECNKITKSNQNCIFCDLCHKWYHLKCINTQLSLSQFTHYCNADEPYYCYKCVQNTLPFQLQSDEEFHDLFSFKSETAQNLQHFLKSSPPEILSLYKRASDLMQQVDNNEFTVLHVNIRSLIKNLDKLKELINAMKMTPDIIAISETWLKPSKLDKICLDGYSFIHSPFKNNIKKNKSLAGGVGCYVKSNLQCTEFNQDLDNDLTNCENLWLKIAMKNNKEIILGVLYRHPRADINDFQEKLGENICKLNNLKLKYYICGDINIDLLRGSTNIKIQEYIDMLVSLGCSSLVNVPTRISATCSTLLDHLYTNDLENRLSCSVLEYDISDHLPIFFSINSSPQRNQLVPVKIRNMKYFDKEVLQTDLAHAYATFESLTNTSNNGSPQAAFKDFIQIFYNVINKNAPMKNLSRKEKHFRQKPWITSAIKKSIKTKNKLYRLKLKNPSNATFARDYKIYRNKLTHVKEHAKRLYYNQLIQENMHNSQKVWKTINEILNKVPKRNNLRIHQILDNKGVIHTDPPAISNTFNNYFAEVGPSMAKDILQKAITLIISQVQHTLFT